jgi:hypothetical protein
MGAGMTICIRWSAVVTSAAAALLGAVELLRHGIARLGEALDAPLPEPAFVAVAEIVVASGGCWLAVGTLFVLLAEPPWRTSGATGQIALRYVPRSWRIAVLAAVGTGLMTGPALASATATSVQPPTDRHLHQPGLGAVAVLDGLVLPDRASGRLHHPAMVVVSRGDCLWSLVAASLPMSATNASIARHTERWYLTNADAIGDDPDLLLPGTRLRVPGSPAD